MDDLYRENILDHYKHPRNFGTLDRATHSSSDSVISCGDSLTMDLLIIDNIVKEVKFHGSGCAISMASASMLSEIIPGKTIAELRSFTKDVILELLGVELTPTRLKCALLSLEVLHKALNS